MALEVATCDNCAVLATMASSARSANILNSAVESISGKCLCISKRDAFSLNELSSQAANVMQAACTVNIDDRATDAYTVAVCTVYIGLLVAGVAEANKCILWNRLSTLETK